MSGTGRATGSTLLEAAQNGQASILAVFGGQGTHNPNCLQELYSTYRSNKQQLHKLISVASFALKQASEAPEAAYEFSTHGFDLLRWMQHPDTAPRQVAIATAPISLPINGLLSLAHYTLTCQALNMHPGQMRKALAGTTGHSQGIVNAVAVAMSSDWESFYRAVADAMTLLLWVGLESHLGSPSSLWASTQRQEDGSPSFASCMLSVRGFKHDELERILDECNTLLDEHDRAYLALCNSDDIMTVSGPAKTLNGLRVVLEERGAPMGLDQVKIPFPQRRKVISCTELPISAAFHSPHLDNAAKRLTERIQPDLFANLKMATSVYHTHTGEDIARYAQKDIVPALIRMIMSEPVNWQLACVHEHMTHVLDFGPGKTSILLRDNMNGSGVRIILVSEATRASELIGGKEEIISKAPMAAPANWASLYGPKLRKDGSGRTQLVTRMSEAFGVPPIMVAGMTPTTVPQDFVSSVINAGYHIELAGGGYAQAKDMEKALRDLAGSIPPTSSITCNLIYVAPRAMAWQIPLIRRLRAEGLPIEGLTIGAGVPSPSVASEYIETLGLKQISFKPSSTDSIRQVLDIAQAHPNFPIMLQWTGGRAGGHHSYEDLHTPILKMYASIRKHDNVILTVGSGFGDAQGMLPYLTGTWSETAGFARMPFDGVLLGSRLMVAKEAHTSLAVKQLIVDTPGVTDAQWYKTYGGAAGGVITVKSEMGEPIHKIANRAVLLWDDLDKTIFSVKDIPKRLGLLQKRRSEIISRLNADYAKPWFAMAASGQAVELDDMTYAECLQRMVELMYMSQKGIWVHDSYKSIFLDFVKRTIERFGTSDNVSFEDSADPRQLLNVLYKTLPETTLDQLYPDDVAFFIGLCRRRGQKPVNFIPRLDETFETWFKKDSLWQMEMLEAVPGQDAQRVCVIHGPVAAKYSTIVNESAADILSKIERDLIEALEPQVPLDPAQIPLAALASTQSLEESLSRLQSVEAMVKSTPQGLQVSCKVLQKMERKDVQKLLEALGLKPHHWLHACLTTSHISDGKDQKPNRILSSFQPGAGDSITVTWPPANDSVESLVLNSKVGSRGQAYANWSVYCDSEKQVHFTLESLQRSKVHASKLELKLAIQMQNGQCVLKDMSGNYDRSIANLFASLWDISSDELTRETLHSTFDGGKTTLTPELLSSFESLMAKASGHPATSHVEKGWAPIDLGIVVAWKALTKPLLIEELGGDISRLLHRSNRFELLPGVDSLSVGDTLEATSRITSLSVQAKGKLVEITATLCSAGAPVMKVISEFFIRGESVDRDQSFRDCNEFDRTLTVDSPKIKALLSSRGWFKPNVEFQILAGTILVFKLHSSSSGKTDSSRLEVTGTVSDISRKGTVSQVGTVHFRHDSCSGNPVLEFLDRYGSASRATTPVDHPGWDDDGPLMVQVRNLGADYSNLSSDHNPIHVNSIFAGFAGLKSPIIHGMYTSAIVRNAIEQRSGNSSHARFRRWYTSFEEPVHGGDLLRIGVEHTAMVGGCMCLTVEVFNVDTGEKVMKAEAEVEQLPTAYLFTGQGSQEKNMGMGSYHSDPIIKAVWDRGDRFLFGLYGFSLLDVVLNNPKKLTVHFGTAKGRKIRQNYLALTRKAIVDGKPVLLPVAEGIRPESQSITFEEPRGLLFSTQFAQPAICLMEAAEMAGLKARGLVQPEALYAGHSLGEYTALHACAEFMSLEGLMGLTFYRGLMMQNQMTRDAEGRTDFSMMAVDPSRVRKGFNEASLQKTVQRISAKTGLLLEIVNFNIAEQQYVCAGHLRALWLLGNVCDSFGQPSQVPAAEELDSAIERFTPGMHSLTVPIELQRGKATIPLSGVNVPFHSSYLHGGIETYRDFLLDHFGKEDVVLERLVGKFIPNVVAKPFATTREYVEDAAKVTGSERLLQMVASWA